MVKNILQPVSWAGALCVAMALGGCATNGSIDTADELARASADDPGTLVFGRFELIRNGHEVELGDGIFANSARLFLENGDGVREITGAVGPGGEFGWLLQPGRYRVTSIGFRYHGQPIEPLTSFTFSVPEGYRASYAGTIRLEASFDQNYLGTRARVDRYAISNDCAIECADRLSAVEVARDEATIALFSWDQQVASID
jgi:hypothetical protein